MKGNKSCCIGVKIRPHLAEVMSHTIIEQSGFLDLSLVIALQNYSYEQL